MRPPTVTLTRALGFMVGLLVCLPVAARAQEGFVVIANVSNPISTMSISEASKLFLRKRTRWPNGQSAQPVDQFESSAVRRRFSNVIHGMDVWSVKSYWQEVVFSGKGDAPPERASDAQIIAFVKANPNAIGYVAIATPTDSVKPITVTR
jgi:ABC-type phosphate transport system substrate-binding protein